LDAATEIGDETLKSVKPALHESVDGAKYVPDEIKN
jgi:hypothetical protein